MTPEIERRWLVMDPPETEPYRSRTLWQGYLTSDGAVSIRIRSIDEAEFWLGIKSLARPDTTLVRHEAEVPLSRAQFEALQAAVCGRPIVKARRTYHVGDVPVDVDLFQGHLQGLIIAEVEFASIDAGDGFDPPTWFGAEVTEDRRFLNSALSQAESIPGF